MSKIIEFHQSGNFTRTSRFLASIDRNQLFRQLSPYAEQGVKALSDATPRRTGETAASWSYEIEISSKNIVISWTNSRMANDGKTPVAILIQQGHGTRNGGYVEGIDYINPALRPVFEKIVEAICDKVVNA